MYPLEAGIKPSAIKMEKNKVLNLGQDNCIHRYRLGNEQLGCSIAEKNVGVIVAHNLSMSQQCTWQDLG